MQRMAIFNAWCDRMPVIVLGATGPVDAVKRRPWIDWIHTARDQGALVRGYVKWDDQPASPGAAREALLRAAMIANAAPQGPVYVNLDAEMQEAKLPEPLPPIDVARYRPRVSTAPDPEMVKEVATSLRNAKSPVILAGRASRSVEAWNARVALAESVNAKVITDMKIGASFPTDHPLHVGSPGMLLPDAEGLAALAAADVILSLDWVDLGGTLESGEGRCLRRVGNARPSHPQWLEHGPSGASRRSIMHISADADVVAIALAREVGAAAAVKPLAPLTARDGEAFGEKR